MKLKFILILAIQFFEQGTIVALGIGTSTKR
jgi:hypothetical protein